MILTAVSNAAFQIRGLTPVAPATPSAPVLLPITNAAAISWKGAAWASSYTIARSTSATGTFTQIGTGLRKTRGLVWSTLHFPN